MRGWFGESEEDWAQGEEGRLGGGCCRILQGNEAATTCRRPRDALASPHSPPLMDRRVNGHQTRPRGALSGAEAAAISRRAARTKQRFSGARNSSLAPSRHLARRPPAAVAAVDLPPSPRCRVVARSLYYYSSPRGRPGRGTSTAPGDPAADRAGPSTRGWQKRARRRRRRARRRGGRPRARTNDGPPRPPPLSYPPPSNDDAPPTHPPARPPALLSISIRRRPPSPAAPPRGTRCSAPRRCCPRARASLP